MTRTGRHHLRRPPRRRPHRRLLAGAVVACLAAVVWVVPSGDTPEVATVPARAPGMLRVMPLGASSTVGVGSPATAGYRLPLWQRLTADGVRVDYVGSRSSGPAALPDRDHEGRSGWSAAGMAPYTGLWVSDAQPDVVLLHAGTNDLLYGSSPQATAHSLDRMLDATFAAAPRAHVIMAGVWAPMPKKRAERAKLGQLMARLAIQHSARGESVEYVDVSHLFAAKGTADGLHAGPAAYRKIAAMWAGHIESWMRRPAPAPPRPVSPPA
ncbi:GDSL-type esterase/lipase family protein [Pseudonocardia phyllosphaerae]|uniref:GDSL-type esterase/lipase family protein n=1 Tax=Pseudonocardia phyllosphaerae TaxID=3390502 RepID=UPI00397A8C7D